MQQQGNTGDDLGQPLGRRDAKGSKGRALPGYGLTRLSGGAFEVLGRAAWAPVLHLLLGYSESPAWPPSHSDNRKVNTPPPPGLGSGQRGSGAASRAPPAGTARQGLFIPWLGAWPCPCPYTSPWARGTLRTMAGRAEASGDTFTHGLLGWGKPLGTQPATVPLLYPCQAGGLYYPGSPVLPTHCAPVPSCSPSPSTVTQAGLISLSR